MVNAQLVAIVERHGVLVVFAAVLSEQLGLPIPAIPVLVVAGTLAAGGALSAPSLLVAAILACLIADGAWYGLGRVHGMRVLKTLCRISLEPDSCVSQTQDRFERWGANSLLFAKFIPGLAVIAPPLAGAMRINPWRFAALSAAGSALWAASGIGAGLIFSAQIGRLFRLADRFGAVAVALVAGGLVAWIAYKWWERRRFYARLRMARISPGDLNSLIQSGGEPVIVDVRTHTARSLEPRWIPSAIHAPVEEMEHRVRELPRDREIILYCACPNEASAARVAKLLMNHGFRHVRPLAGGLDAWVAAGYDVETAAAPDSARAA